MKTIRSWMLVGMVALAAAVPPASAHPGRTDSKGCHTCRTNCAKWGLRTGQYHCHGSESRSAISRVSPPPPPASLTKSSVVLPESPTAPLSQRLQLEVLVIIDGDTFVARRGTDLFLLKLRDVEAPELEQPYGQEARDRLRSQIWGQQIVAWPERGAGCLISARVEMPDGTDVTKKLLSEGTVWAMPSAPDHQRRLEEQARAQKLGLWRGSDPESPWVYRRRTRAND